MGLLRQQNVWQCDHCKKEGVWGKDWRSKLVLHKSGGPGPWDEELVACSQKCQDAIDQKRRWKNLPDKSKGEPAVEIGGAALVPNAVCGIRRECQRTSPQTSQRSSPPTRCAGT